MDLLPRSGLAHSSLGFLAISLHFHLDKFSDIFLIIWTLVGIAFLIASGFLPLPFHIKYLIPYYSIRFDKIRYIGWGILVGCLFSLVLHHISISNKEKIDHFLHFKNNHPNTSIHLVPENKILGRTWIFQITLPGNQDNMGNLPIKIPIQRKYNNYPRNITCKLFHLTSKELGKEHYLYRPLQPYGNTIFYLDESRCRKDNDPPPGELARTQVGEALKKGGIKGEMAGIAMGLVFGDSSYLTQDIYKVAQKTGTLHLFAASGLHMGILMGSLFYFGKKVFRLGYYSGILFPFIVSIFYLHLLSYPISLTRAMLFFMLFGIGKFLFRRIHLTDLLIISSTIIYIFKRESFLSVGFLLSYLAVFGIFFLKPRFDQIILSHSNANLVKLFKNNLTVSLSANLATLPVVWFYFEGYSFGSVLTNFILVPLAGLLLPILYLSLAWELTLPFPLTNILWSITDLLLRSLLVLNELASETIGFYREWNSGGHEIILLSFLILALFIYCGIRQTKRQDETSDATQTMIKKSLSHRLIHMSFVLLLFLWFFYGYRYNSPLVREKEKGLVFFSDNSYLWSTDEKLYLGGYCKYDSGKIKKYLDHDLCKTSETIYIDHDSCMHLARICQKQNGNLGLEFGSRYMKEWMDTLPTGSSRIVPKNSLFDWGNESVLIYKSGFDPPWLPNYLHKKGKGGKILIQNPPKKSNGKTLGRWKGWEILSLDHGSLSLLQSQRNPKGSEKPWSGSSEDLGSELFD